MLQTESHKEEIEGTLFCYDGVSSGSRQHLGEKSTLKT
jgi:hypothetical protein